MENKKPEEHKLEIEISKYKNLVDALGNPLRVARMILLIAAVAAILALGIIGVVYGIKRFYPYKSINSNPYGATIIQDEDNEIIYWLFNSADLWANSGIEVEEGDVISVRTSGAYHTAIHHLVEDADSNTMIRNPWSHSTGDSPSYDSPLYDRNRARAKYRIAPNHSQNTILMQVIPSKVGKKDGEFDWRTDTSNACYLDGRRHTLYNVDDHYKSGLKTEQKEPDIYEIGIGKENIRIRTNGILHFTVNDIALTRYVIKQMKEDQYIISKLKLNTVTGVRYASVTAKFVGLFTQDGWNTIKDRYQVESIKSSMDSDGTIISSEEWNRDNLIASDLINELNCPNKKYWNITSLCNNKLVSDGGFSDFIRNPGGGTRVIGDTILIINRKCISNSKLDTSFLKPRWHIKKDSIIINKYECLSLDSTIFEINKYLECEGYLSNSKSPCEIDYYYDKNFVDAWFADNIGSFMIVIERKKVR